MEGLVMEEKKPPSDALEWLYNEFVGNDPERVASYQEERIRAEIARQIYDLREAAGLSQKEVADLVGPSETVIDDLEEADYEGDALSMLVKIATVLNKRIEVHFTTSGKWGHPSKGL
jgi:ribosome-binding protein aMBF1 (putative translation factor)